MVNKDDKKINNDEPGKITKGKIRVKNNADVSVSLLHTKQSGHKKNTKPDNLHITQPNANLQITQLDQTNNSTIQPKITYDQTNNSPAPSKTNVDFSELCIPTKILKQLTALNFTTPTPIQTKAIPIAIKGRDLIGIAQTGTGKTLSYIIPIYYRLAQMPGTAVVLVPTRELAIQIDEEFRKICGALGIKTAVIIGGAPMYPQISALRKNPSVIIATPGRLMDHIKRRNVFTDDICIVVLDEADRMLDMGFMPQIDSILQNIKNNHQTLLFSATLSKEILNIANSHMISPINIEIATPGTVADNIAQELFVVSKENKVKLLLKLIEQYKGSVLLFTRTKYSARDIAQIIREKGHSAAEIHSNLSLGQRRDAMAGFKSKKYRILVATDIASRGIDAKGIELVINYDVPEEPESYVHRIGRTGRMGHEGRAITFATSDQKRDVDDIERLIKTTIPLSTCQEIPSESFSKGGFSGRRSFGSRKGYEIRHDAKDRRNDGPKRSYKKNGFREEKRRGGGYERRTSRRDSGGSERRSERDYKSEGHDGYKHSRRY